MNKTIKALLITLGIAGAAGAAYYFYAMRGGSAHLKYVPKEAAFVGSINLKSLASKVDVPRLKKMNLYKEMMRQLENQDELSILAQVMAKPEESGVNLMSPIYFYASMKRKNLDNGGVVIAIRNAGDFEKMLRKASTEGGIEKDDKYKHVQVDNNMILGWNDDAAVFVFTDDEDDLEKELDNAMAMEKSESILAEDKFKDFLKKDADAGVWMNYKTIADLAPNGEMQAELLKQYGLEDAAIEWLLNFETNKIAMALNVIYDSKSGEDVVNILNDKGLSEDHLKTISPENVYAIFSASVNFKELIATLSKNKEFKSSIAEMKDNLGLSNSDLEELLTGEISFAVIDFDDYTKNDDENFSDSSMFMPPAAEDPFGARPNPYFGRFAQYNEDEFYPSDGEVDIPTLPDYGDEYGYNPYMYQQPAPPKLPGMMLSFSAKNTGAIERILKKMELTKDEEGIYTISLEGISAYLAISKSGFVITNNRDAAESMVKKKEFKIPQGDYKEKVTEHPMAMWVDLDMSHYPKKLMTKLEDELGKRNFELAKEKMKPFTGFEMLGSSKGAEFALNMNDDKKSSLMRIIEMIDEEMD